MIQDDISIDHKKSWHMSENVSFDNQFNISN